MTFLYDLIADPGETRNCLEAYPDVAEDFRAAVALAREIRGKAKPAARIEVDPETVEALRALGYL